MSFCVHLSGLSFTDHLVLAGPAEIAYFAQFNFCTIFDIPELSIYPRASLTIIEERVQKIID